ncbi:MAG: hypothetical protein V8T31_11770 [Lachnospiraceae bacterium]
MVPAVLPLLLQFRLLWMEIKEIAIFNRHGRSWERGQKLVDTINAETHCQASLYDLADTTEMRHQLSDSAILINGTSVGMAPNTDLCPLSDLSGLHEEKESDRI